MKIFLMFLAISAFGCFAQGGKTADEPAKNETIVKSSIPQVADSINLYNITAELASPDMKGRLTGTEEGKICEDYVKNKMKGLNLDYQTQEVDFPLYQVLTPTSLKVFDNELNKIFGFKYTKDYKEVDFSGSGKVSGKLVYVGYGIDSTGISPYEKIDVKGKVVAILSGIPEGYNREWARIDKKIDAAVKRGALATIIIPAGRTAQFVAQRGDEAKMFALDFKRNPVFDIIHENAPSIFLHQEAVVKIMGKDEKALIEDLTPRELNKTVDLELRAKISKKVVSDNVFGVIHGTDPEVSKEVIIVGAHYDHLGVGADGRIYHGATDNATGTAVVLEAAKYFSNLKEKPKRTIVFALWTGEEQGLHGSNHYVYKSPILPLEQTKLMIQVDCLGKEQGPYLSNVNDEKIIQKFAGTAINEKSLNVVDWKGRCASDDCAFLAKGIPAYRFISYGYYHHMTEDTIKNVDVEILETVTNIIIDGLKKTAFE